MCVCRCVHAHTHTYTPSLPAQSRKEQFPGTNFKTSFQGSRENLVSRRSVHHPRLEPKLDISLPLGDWLSVELLQVFLSVDIFKLFSTNLPAKCFHLKHLQFPVTCVNTYKASVVQAPFTCKLKLSSEPEMSKQAQFSRTQLP